MNVLINNWRLVVVMTTGLVLFKDFTHAVVTEEHGSTCNDIYDGKSGEIYSPDYPEEYPDNLGCQWIIKVSNDSRIKIIFDDFQLEQDAQCFDKVVVFDGIQKESPSLGTFCGNDATGISITSSRNTMSIQLVSDESIGDRGVKISWKAIPRIDIRNTSNFFIYSTWVPSSYPNNLVDFEPGLTPNTVWAIDSNFDNFYFDGLRWDINSGKFRSISVGDSGIFALQASNYSIYWRSGASFENPKGGNWKLISRNDRKIRFIESTYNNIIFGVDYRGELFYAEVKDIFELDTKWRKFDVYLNGNELLADQQISSVTCGVFSCWILTRDNNVYSSTILNDITKMRWTKAEGKYKLMTSGYGNNVWAIDTDGKLYKREQVTSSQPSGSIWVDEQNITASIIRAGISGVFAYEKDLGFMYKKDSVCGEIKRGNNGEVSSPNFPDTYPRNIVCLWIIQVPKEKHIELNFEPGFDIRSEPDCNDYLATSYPGIQNPISECGRQVYDKRIEANFVWVEFVSDNEDEGKGFKFNYAAVDASLPIPTTIAPLTLRPFLPSNIKEFNVEGFFRQHGFKPFSVYDNYFINRGNTIYNLVSSKLTNPSIWLSVEKGGKQLKDVSSDGNWALDVDNNLLQRDGSKWVVVQPDSDFSKVISGPSGELLVIDYNNNNNLYYRYLDKNNNYKWELVQRNVKDVSFNRDGIWTITSNGDAHFVFPKINNNGIFFDVTSLNQKGEKIASNSNGNVYVTKEDGSIFQMVQTRRPFGKQFIYKPIVGIKAAQIYDGIDTIFLRTDGNRLYEVKPESLSSLGQWEKVNVEVASLNPYKIDAYPSTKFNVIDLWILGGQNGQIPYKLEYNKYSDNKFTKVGENVNLIDLSAGESGVWAINQNNQAVRYDKDQNKWLTLPDQKSLQLIESASPYHTVYAIDDANLLFYRDGISVNNLVGTKWVDTGINAHYISSGPYHTYVYTKDKLMYFNSDSTETISSDWENSWKNVNSALVSKLSVGFDGSVVILDLNSVYNNRQPQTISLMKEFETEERLRPWKEGNIKFQDVTAGPVHFGILNGEIFFQNVSPCYKLTARQSSINTFDMDNTKSITCNWLISVPDSTLNVRMLGGNLNGNCDAASINYESPNNPGTIEQQCDQTEFIKRFKDRVFLQFNVADLNTFYNYKLFAQLENSRQITTATPTGTTTPDGQISTCGGNIYRNNGVLVSPGWPSDYESSLDCAWYFSVADGKRIVIELVYADFESTSCRYDYLLFTDSLLDSGKSLGKFCTKNSVIKSTGNTMKVLLHTDSSGVGKGFKANWYVEPAVYGSSTTKAPITIPDNWKRISQVSHTRISPGPDSDILGIDSNSNGVIIKTNTPGSTDIKKSLSDIILFDKNLYVLNANRDKIYTRPLNAVDKNNWQAVNVNLEGRKVNKIVDGLFGVYVVNEFNEILQLLDGLTPNPKLRFVDNGKDISESPFGYWIVKDDGTIRFSPYDNDRATQIESPLGENNRVKTISTSLNDKVYAIAENGDIFERDGISKVKPYGYSWKKLNINGVKDIAADKNQVSLLLKDGSLISKEYEYICGEVLTNKKGSIVYPKVTNQYKKQYCLWYIDVPDVNNIYLRQQSFNVEKSTGCYKHSVTIFSIAPSGTNQNAILCGEGLINKEFSLKSNKVFVEYKSDGGVTGQNFLFKYDTVKESKCDETLFTSPSGIITSPGFPGYGPNELCSYKIRMPVNNNIKLTFSNFDLQPAHSGNSCDYDRLLIYEVENNGKRNLVQTMCGSRNGEVFTSSQNNLDLVFQSDNLYHYGGFRLRYESISTIKSTTTTTRKPIINGWSEIKLSGNERFKSVDASVTTDDVWAVNTQNQPSYYNKRYNRFIAISNPTSGSIQISPGDTGVYAVGDDGDLFFREGVTYANKGGGQWRKFGSDKRVTMIDHGPNNEIIGISDKGEVVSWLNNKYKSLISGFKSVTVGYYGYWMLNERGRVFFSSYIPSSSIYNSITIVPITGNFKKITAGFGGNVWAITQENKVYRRTEVNFLNPSGKAWEKNDGLHLTDISAGYDGVYGITPDGNLIKNTEYVCGGIFATQSGMFRLETQRNIYKPNANCLFIIDTPLYNRLTVTFPQFDVEKSLGCYKDYLLTSVDGKYPSKYAVEKDCGKNVSPKVFKDKAWFEFSSDDNLERPGFELNWKAVIVAAPKTTTTTTQVIKTTKTTTTTSGGKKYFKNCGGSLSGSSGTIVHPNYPEEYLNSQQCNYVITVDINKRVKISLKKVALESSVNCDYDYIEITDSFSNRKKRYCSAGPHQDFISEGRNVLLYFYSDEIGRRGGFELEWSAVSDVTTPFTTITSTPKTACKKVLKAYSDYVYHNKYPRHYENNVNCIWIMEAPLGSIINLEFRLFNLEDSPNCVNDYLAIYDGDSNQAPLIVKRCGKNKPAVVESTSNVLSIVLKTNDDISNQGFIAIYKHVQNKILPSTPVPKQISTTPKTNVKTTKSTIQDCAFFQNGNTGKITSPNYPNNYPNNKDCKWTITTSPDSRIQISFEAVTIEDGGSSCVYDFLEIFDGDNVNSPRIARICGNKKPNAILTGTNKAIVHFKSDDRGNRPGFAISWKKIDTTTAKPTTLKPTTAGITPTSIFIDSGIQGTIKTPNYPKNYKLNVDYYWRISAPENMLIEIEFVDIDIEYGGSICYYDYLEVYDGIGKSDKPLVRLCGRKIPKMIKSVSNELYLHFHSDDRQAYKGFNLKWTAVAATPISTLSPSTTPVKTTTLTTEVRKFNVAGDQGYITSPNHPAGYGVNKDYYWTINTAPNTVVEISFEAFQVLDNINGECNNDFVKIIEYDETKYISKYLCGNNLPANIKATGRTLVIHFHADSENDSSGFKLLWKGVSTITTTLATTTTTTVKPTTPFIYPEAKDFLETGEYGIIKSPNYPLPYGMKKDYYWTISTTPSKIVEVFFEDFDIEDKQGYCRTDFIEIFDGIGATDNLLGKYCGNKKPSSIRSTGNKLYIHFRADDKNDRKGFRLRWNALYIKTTTKRPTTTFIIPEVQDFLETGEYGTIQSPNYPLPYGMKKDYYWTISTTPSKVVEVFFEDFDIEDKQGYCRTDFIEIFDGIGATDNLLGKYCGDKKPSSIRSTGNKLYIHFRADDKNDRKGFRLRWNGFYITTTTKTPTTASIIAEVRDFFEYEDYGTIKSPNYPNKYGFKKDYYWTISITPSKLIKILFEDFDVENSKGNCQTDFLQIFDGIGTSDKSLGKFCGNEKPSSIQSSSSKLYIHFHADDKVDRNGFRLRWISLDKISSTIKPITTYINPEVKDFFKTDPQGAIKSPNYPNKYGFKKDYYWTISTKPNTFIEIIFGDFDVENSKGNCQTDFLQIFDGIGTSDKSLGKFCGNVKPDNIKSSGNKLYIHFHADDKVDRKGFRLRWVTFDKVSSTIKPTTKFIFPEFKKFFESGKSGIIKTPGYPDNYGIKKNFYWTITVLNDQIIELQFNDFDVETSKGGCTKDFLQVYDGSWITYPLLGKFCGQVKPSVLRSSGNQMYLHFLADDDKDRRGFQLAWRAVDKPGIKTTPVTTTEAFVYPEVQDFFMEGTRGAVTSPNYPSNYGIKKNYFWTINTSPRTYIEVTFQDMDIQGSVNNCYNDFLRIYDGESSKDPLLKHLCGTIIPLPIKSTNNLLYMHFKADRTIEKKGFRLSWKEVPKPTRQPTTIATIKPEERYSVTGSNGFISSPNYPRNYNLDQDVYWLITVSKDKTIELSFDELDIEDDQYCRKDYLLVFDGNSVTNDKIASYCGTSRPDSISSSGNSMFIHFHSNEAVSKKGFKLPWKAVIKVATTTASTTTISKNQRFQQFGKSGRISSLNYPQNYDNDLRYQWTIEAPKDKVIEITFDEVDIESGGSSCSYDYLSIYDGGYNTDKLLGKYCGKIQPSPLRSPGNKVHFYFNSDDRNTRRGFRLSWKAVDRITTTATTITTTPTVPQVKEYRLRGDEGRITSAMFPEIYPKNLYHYWFITAPKGKVIEVTFNEMDIQYDRLCSKDYLAFYDGSSRRETELGKYCGTQIPNPLRTSQNELYINFHTDSSNERKGFSINWKAVDRITTTATTITTTPTVPQVKEYRLRGNEGRITSAKFPELYPKNLYHYWFITAPKGKVIEVTFNKMDIQYDSLCSKDYLAFYDGSSRRETELGKYCGTQIPNPLRTSQNELYINFHTDGSYERKGFSINWRAVDLVTTTTTATTTVSKDLRFKQFGKSGQITSLNYPQNYGNDLRYQWSIEAPKDKVIEITFDEVDIESGGSSCSYDFLSIHDGDSNTDKLLGKYCGRIQPSPLRSTGNKAHLYFKTDDRNTRRGFRLSWKAVDRITTTVTTTTTTPAIPKEKSYKVTGNQGSATSPNFPEKYPNNLNHYWLITVPKDKIIEVLFNKIAIQYESLCRRDYLAFYDGNSKRETLLGRYCGTNNPNPLRTSQNELYVHFRTDELYADDGFSFNWRAVDKPSTTTTTTTKVTTTVKIPKKVEHSLNGNGGVIYSPNYPSNYNDNQDVYWYITVDKDETIEITFDEVDIEDGKYCRKDYLRFFNQNEVSDVESRYYCGSTPSTYPIKSTANKIAVHFHSDKAINRKGFKLSWKAVKKPTAKPATTTPSIPKDKEYKISGTAGMLFSPKFPERYPNYLNHYWLITVPKGKVIEVLFNKMDIQYESLCRRDYLAFYNGNSRRETLLGKYCGTTNPSPLRTSQNELYVHFHTDGSYERKGFSINWSAVDMVTTTTTTTTTTTISKNKEYKLRGTEGTVSSPNFPENYPMNLNHYWLITVPKGKIIEVLFNKMDIQYESSCRRDYLAFYDGNSRRETLLGKYCGTTNPSPLRTSQNELYVHFHTDASSSSNKGFSINWRAVDMITTTATTTTTISKDKEYKLRGTEGTVSSPNFPENYPMNLNHYWLITVPRGKAIEVLFNKMDIQKESLCRRDYLAFYDGNSRRETLLGKYCGTTNPSPLRTSQNELYVHFHTDASSSSNKGFSINWRAVYMITTTATTTTTISKDQRFIQFGKSGQITSLNYPQNYGNDLRYQWTIEAPKDKVIEITFDEVDIESGGSTCSYDYLSIYDGDSNTDKLLGKYCGRIQPSPLRSTGNKAHLYFKTDDRNTRRGFRLSWKAVDRITTTVTTTTTTPAIPKEKEYITRGTAGTLSSPSFPELYPKNINHYWLITVPKGRVIEVTFNRMDIQYERFCRKDYVAFYDGSSRRETELGKYCGTTNPNPLRTSQNELYVHFHTDESYERKGFSINWRAVDMVTTTTTRTTTISKDQRFIQFGKSGQITSLNYPQNYGNDLRYQWTIEAPIDKEIEITFDEVDIESGGSTCSYDHLSIYDGDSNTDKLLGKYCGRIQPSPLRSTGNKAHLYFKTDDRNTRRGFRLSWKAVDRITTTVTTTTTTPAIPKEKEYITRGTAGTLSSPSFPELYPKNINHYWLITVPKGRVIEVTFNRMDIQYERFCRKDYLAFYDGSSRRETELGKYCGTNNPNPLRTSQNELYVHFHTDGSYEHKGFSINWRAVDMVTTTATTTTTISKTQRFILSGDNGVIKSLNYPGNYANNLRYYWTIKASPNKLIQLNFDELDIEQGPSSCYDYLSIFDGESDYGKLIGQYCGKTRPSTITSSGNAMHLFFRTDTKSTQRGFKIYWQAIDRVTTTAPKRKCEFRITGRSGVISHPSYPDNYKNNQDCKWYITSSPGTIIKLLFNDIQIESTNYCLMDYVDIRDGANFVGSKQLGRFCGTRIPKQLYTSANKMFIRFYSDSQNVDKGFKLAWKAVPEPTKAPAKKCEALYTYARGRFQHKNAPYKYNPNQDCTYKIRAPRNLLITLYFPRFDIETSPNCENDYILITEGSGSELRTVGKYCGGNLPPIKIITSRNLFTVRFVTNGEIEKSGFKVIYFFSYKRASRATDPPTVRTTTVRTTPATTTTTTTKPVVLTTRRAVVTVIRETLPSGPIGKNMLLRTSKHVSGLKGVINHPSYPKDYLNNVFSTWTITVDNGDKINLRFDSFSVQRDYPQCRNDYLAVYDGDTLESKLLGKYCGDNIPRDIRSSDNKMLVVFESDSDITSSGFVAKWDTVTSKNTKDHDICDEAFFIPMDIGEEVTIVSPGYNTDRRYPVNKYCMMQLVTMPNNIFKIRFDDMSLSRKDSSTGRCKDLLSIRDGEKATSKEILSICGLVIEKPLLYTTDNKVALFFYTDYLQDYFARGFKLRLTTIEKPKTFVSLVPGNQCGGHLFGHQGSIINPASVNSDSKYATCVWTIETEPSSIMKINFNQIDLPGTCDSSYIIIRDGGSSGSQLMDKYCKSTGFFNLYSSSNKIWIEYKTPVDGNIGRFAMNWEQVTKRDTLGTRCGGTVTGQSGYLASPFYPKVFTNSLFCVWNIMVGEGEKISLKLQDMRVGIDCSKSYVTIRDGMSSEARLLGKYCPQQRPIEIVSTGRAMWVEMKARCGSKAFQAYWNVIRGEEPSPVN